MALHQTLIRLHKEINKLEEETRTEHCTEQYQNNCDNEDCEQENILSSEEAVSNEIIEIIPSNLQLCESSCEIEDEIGNEVKNDKPDANNQEVKIKGCEKKLSKSDPFICDGHGDTDKDKLILSDELIYCDDPFNLPSCLYENASFLASLAFQFECHGNLLDYVEFSQICMADSCDTLQTIENVHVNKSDNELVETPVVPAQHSTHETCQDDVALAAFLRLYFHLIANDTNSLQSAVLQSSGSICERWRSLVKCIQGKHDLVRAVGVGGNWKSSFRWCRRNSTGQ